MERDPLEETSAIGTGADRCLAHLLKHWRSSPLGDYWGWSGLTAHASCSLVLGRSIHVRPLLMVFVFYNLHFYPRQISCSIYSYFSCSDEELFQHCTCSLALNSDTYTAKQVHTCIRFKHVLVVSGEYAHGLGRLGRKWCLPTVSSSCGQVALRAAKGREDPI